MATRKRPVSYRIFREHYDRLVHAIQDPLPLATRLLSLRIITPAVKEDISAVGLPTLNKNRILLSAVEKQIQLHPQTFHVFISALKEDPLMQLLVDSMQSKCFLREHVNCLSNPPPNLQPILILIIPWL